MNFNKIYIVLWVVLLSSCLGDKKPVSQDEMAARGFINDNFKGNKIDFSKKTSACEQLVAPQIADLYQVAATDVLIQDAVNNNGNSSNVSPSCQFYIKTGDNDFEWLRGSMTVQPEIKKDEYMGEIAEATGAGENWQEAWALKKSMSNSAEWIPELGKAALWNPSKNLLEVKYDGYTLKVIPLRNKLNKIEVGKQRDYKKMAVEMVKLAGY